MWQDRKCIRIGVAPIGTDNDLRALSQSAPGDLCDDAIRKADLDVYRLDKVALSDPEKSPPDILGGGGLVRIRP